MREDPVFGLVTPLLFAHRGGRLEVAESTPLAFAHARVTARAEVLEIDVQRTADGTLVVWHGPSLENVRIGGFPDRPARRKPWQNDITQLDWSLLDGNAWVADPRPAYDDLGDVPEDRYRRILKLADFLRDYPHDAVNLEIKPENFGTQHVEGLLDAIQAARGQRTVLVVSQSRELLARYRDLARTKYPGETFPTGLAAREVLAARLRSSLPLLDVGPMQGRALQTTHHAALTPRSFVRAVQARGGAVHLFITGFGPLGALDAQPGQPSEAELFPLLERGVDGIMTDRPAAVRPLLDAWQRKHAGAAGGA